jgi:hypothetical protein
MTPNTRKEHWLARIAGEDDIVLEPQTREEHYYQKIIDSGGGGGSGAVSSVNGKTGTVVLTASDVGAAAAETVVTVEGSTPAITPAANTIYSCGTLTSLTITDPPATGSYSIVFTSGATATSTTIPSTILGLESFAAEANTLYEINVLDNRAVVGSWAVSA